VVAEDVVHLGEFRAEAKLTFDDGTTIFRAREDGKGYVYIDGRTAGNINEAQDRINKMLGLTPKQMELFCKVSSQFGLSTDTERKAIFDQMLGGDRFKPYHEALSAKLDAQRKTLEKVAKDHGDAVINVLVAEADLVYSRDLADCWGGQQAEAIRKEEDRVEALSRELELAREQLQGYKREQAGLKLMDIEGNLAVEQTLISLLAVAKASPYLGDMVCGSCGQALPSAPTAAERSSAETQVAKLEADLAVVQSSIKSARQQEKYVDGVAREIARLTKDVESLSEKLRTRQKELSAMIHAPNPHAQKPVWAKEALEEANKTVADLASKMAKANAAVEETKALLQVFGNKGIKTFLFDLLKVELNQHLADCLAVLSDGKLEATVELDEDGKVLFVVTYADGMAGYKANSSGTQSKLDLAFAFSANRLFFPQLRLLLADEYACTLDSKAALRAFELLGSFDGVALVTSHREIKETIYASRIQVVRQAGCSRIEG
jgi:DNA repair exonuclease SbcCD ATPase subunit